MSYGSTPSIRESSTQQGVTVKLKPGCNGLYTGTACIGKMAYRCTVPAQRQLDAVSVLKKTHEHSAATLPFLCVCRASTSCQMHDLELRLDGCSGLADY